MDLTIRYTWLLTATLVFTIASLSIFIARSHCRGIYRFNDTIIRILGIAENYPKWAQWLVKWVLSSGIAALLLSLIINTIDTFFLLLGQTGIYFDPAIVPIAIIMIAVSIFLLFVCSIPVLATPPSCPTALAIMTALHLYGFHYVLGLQINLYNDLAFGSTFLYFLTIGIGVIGAFIAVYVLLRHYLIVKLTSLLKKEDEPLPSS